MTTEAGGSRACGLAGGAGRLRSKPRTMNLTKRAIEALPAPAKGYVRYPDKVCRGLCVQVFASGVKQFAYYRAMKGSTKPYQEKIGRCFSDVASVEKARELASRINARVAAGDRPDLERDRLKAEATLGELFDLFKAQKDLDRKKSTAEMSAQFRRYVAPAGGGRSRSGKRLGLQNLAARKVSSLEKADFQSLHNSLSVAGLATTANRVIALASSMFNWAIKQGKCKDNPAEGIEQNREAQRDRFLQAGELQHFFDAVGHETNPTARDFFLLALFTGARRANVLSMRWEDVFIDENRWRIPDTKNGTPQTVPLVPLAVQILKIRKADRPRKDGRPSPWVFPADSKTGHLVEPKSAWRRVLNRAEMLALQARLQDSGATIEQQQTVRLTKRLAQVRAAAERLGIDTAGTRLADLRIHDLRRTLGSWQAKQGASLSVIGKSLNHKSMNTTQIYARLDEDPVRASMVSATSAIAERAGYAPAKVTNIEEVRKPRKAS